MLAAGAVADRRGEHPIRSAGLGQALSNHVGDGSGDPGVGVQRQVRSMLLGGTYRDH